MIHHLSLRQLFFILTLAFCGLLAASALSAWTGPTASAPDGNVAAPVNVGTTDQVKKGGLSVNAFAAFGNAYVSGNLGIGVTNPAQKLVVTGNSWLTGNLIVQSGNVGIGVTNPAAYAKLAVNGRGALDYAIFSDFTSATLRIGAISGDVRLRTDGTQDLLLMPGGRVGVGTLAPVSKLDVNGEIKVAMSGVACSAANEGSIRYETTSNVLQYCNSVSWVSVGAPVAGGESGNPFYGTAHTKAQCQAAGGTVTDYQTYSFCRFTQASCPAGWTKYNNLSSTNSNTCTGTGVNFSCQNGTGSYCSGTSCSTGGHAFSNATRESCGYGNGTGSCRFVGGEAQEMTFNGCSVTSATCYATITSVGCY